MDNNKEIKRLHAKIEQELKGHLSPDDVKSLKRKMASIGYKAGELSSVDNFYDLWAMMEKRGKIKPGNYDILKQMFHDMQNMALALEELNCLEKEIKELLLTVEANDSLPSPVSTTTTPPTLSLSNIHMRPRDRNRHYTQAPGYLLIINQFKYGRKARQGTIYDESNLIQFFVNTLAYEHRVIEDVGWSELQCKLHQVQRVLSEDGHKFSCFICAILSHGNEHGVLMYNDDIEDKDNVRGEYIPVEEIMAPFKADQLKSMIGKPKIFLIQACRGGRPTRGVSVADDEPREEVVGEEEGDADYVAPTIPLHCDILLAYSTTHGFQSWRRNTEGSWFVSTLCRVFSEEYRREHLVDMLTEVNRRVAAEEHLRLGHKQMPCIMSQLTKKLYLHHDHITTLTPHTAPPAAAGPSFPG